MEEETQEEEDLKSPLWYKLLTIACVASMAWIAAGCSAQTPVTQEPDVVETVTGRLPAINDFPGATLVHLQVNQGDAKAAAFSYLAANSAQAGIGIVAEAKDGSSIVLGAAKPMYGEQTLNLVLLALGRPTVAASSGNHAGFMLLYVYKGGKSTGIQAYADVTFQAPTRVVCALGEDGKSLGYVAEIVVYAGGMNAGMPVVVAVYEEEHGLSAIRGSTDRSDSTGRIQNHRIELGEGFTGNLRVLVAPDPHLNSPPVKWLSIRNEC